MKKRGLILLALFLLSVFIRIPTLNRPLSKHHEFCTAVSLRVMQIWDEAGIATYNFNPVMTYPNIADKFINNYASGSGKMLDEQGNYYYVSHPPFAYYIPYFLFQLLGVRPDVLPIQLFNLLLHFISAIGVYLIARDLTPAPSPAERGIQSELHSPALTSFIFYLFSAATMWFQSNTYMSDMVVQPLFIFGVLYALKYFDSGKRAHLILLSCTAFFMTYTTWLGVFFVVALIIAALVRFKKISSPALFIGFVSLVSFLSVALTVFQYAQIAGWDTYFAEAFGRFSERSGMHTGWRIFFLQWRNIVFNYGISYFPLLLIVFFLLLNKSFTLPGISLPFFFAALPVILLNLALPNYSGHDFVSLYGAVFLSVMAGIQIPISLKRDKQVFIGTLTMYILISMGHFYFINRPGEISQRGDRYADFKEIGIAIGQNADSEEVIFLLNEKPGPEVIFYAGRNILRVSSEKEAIEHLQISPANKGVILKRAPDSKVVLVKRISE